MTAPTMIHVRFAPDGSVFEIGERPQALSAQQWFTRLSEKYGTEFQTLSGGRGFFRLAPDAVEALKASISH
jgi:hypothetical protein